MYSVKEEKGKGMGRKKSYTASEKGPFFIRVGKIWMRASIQTYN
jgi:hypothetical protein